MTPASPSLVRRVGPCQALAAHPKFSLVYSGGLRDSNGQSPLLCALRQPLTPVLVAALRQTAVGRQANGTEPLPPPIAADDHGSNALHVACYSGQIEVRGECT